MRPNLESLASILAHITKPFEKDPSYQLALCQTAWVDVLGEGSDAMVRKFILNDGILTVYCKSDAFRHEVSAEKTQLLQSLNETIEGFEILELQLR